MPKGPCAKRRVVCLITLPNLQQFRGENDCENPQPSCPRWLGEGYEKCTLICRQSGHAEIEALRAAGGSAAGGRADIWGHYWICEPCGRALLVAGITDVTIHTGEPP